MQGVAGVALTSPSGDEMLLSLLAAGSAEPDVLAFRLNDPESMAATRRALSTTFPLYRHSAGLLAIDVLDIPGATVAQVEAGGAGAAAGLVPGDLIVSANAQPVKSVTDLERVLGSLPEDRGLALDVRGPAGGVRKAQLTASLVPRALVMTDQTLLANKAILDLRQRLPTAINTAEEPVVRLNLAIALMHVKSWAAARAELERVTMPNAPGISNGTVQDLLGLVLRGARAASRCRTGVEDGGRRRGGSADRGRPADCGDGGQPAVGARAQPALIAGGRRA